MRYIFEITWLFWFLSEVLLSRLYRSKTGNTGDPDKSSLRLIWITIIISISLGIVSKFWLIFSNMHSDLLRYTGLLFIVTGIIVRFISIKTLGKFFTVDLAIHDDHKLIKNGLYKYIRHPSYSGSLLSFLGFGLSMDNWVSLIIIFIPVLISFINRINIEENLLSEQAGLEYSSYKRNTKRLIPWIY